MVPAENSSFTIGFLAPIRPLEILCDTDAVFQKNALFGCGLCSVVLVSEDAEWVKQFVNDVESKLYGWEIWTVRDGKLVDRSNDAIPAPPAEPAIVLNTEGVQDDSTIWMIQELSLNLNRFYANARRFAPFITDELKTLAAEVRELIQEIIVDETALFIDPAEIDAKRGEEGEQGADEQSQQQLDTLLRQKKRLNTNVDLLVQLNSAFVYAVGQAFHAALPIHQRGGHISQHALLGTGSAWRAFHRLCSSAFAIFRTSRFPERLRQRLEATKPDVHSTLSGSQDESDNGEQELSELRLNTRIVHFSARRGFGESDGAITCPSQALQVCNEPEWSLSTTTHEILHAHVRELIAAILVEALEPDVPLPQEQALAKIVSDYQKFSVAQKRGNPRRSQLNEVRFGLIEFALSYRNAVDKAKTKHQITQPEFEVEEIYITLPREIEGTFRAFKKSFRLLEETVVHILDLHYFYGGDSELFCDSVWYGWSIVPSVIEKLDWYILRSLLALASRTSGGDYERLAAAAEILSDSLNRIRRQKKGFVIASEVLRRIDPLRQSSGSRNDSAFFKWIDLLFPACLPLVDLTTTFFLSNALQREFASRDNDLTDEDGRWLLEPVDFSIKEVKAPIGLIYARLRSGLEAEGIRSLPHDEIARRSAFMLVAASSSPVDVDQHAA